MEDINDEDEGTKLKKRRRNVNEVPITRLRTMPITRWSGRITLQYEIMGFNVREVFRFFIIAGGRGHALSGRSSLSEFRSSSDLSFFIFNPVAGG